MHNAADPHSPPVSPELPLVSKVLVSRKVKNISPILPVNVPGWELTTAKNVPFFIFFTIFSCLDVSQLCYKTRPKPAYIRQGLAGGIVGPGYFSSGQILGCSQRLASRLRRLARRLQLNSFGPKNVT